MLNDGVTKVIEPYPANAIVEKNIDVSRAVESLAQRYLALGVTDDITANTPRIYGGGKKVVIRIPMMAAAAC